MEKTRIHRVFLVLPPAARGKAHGAWRFAHSVNSVIRFAPCAWRFAHIPLQKLLIKGCFIHHLSSVFVYLRVTSWLKNGGLI